VGEGPELVRADLSHGEDDFMKADILEYFAHPFDSDRHIIFSWERKNIPAKAAGIEMAKGFVWVESSTTHLPANEEVCLMSDKRDLEPVKGRWYQWDFRNNSPMFLMILPTSISLEDAKPYPSGVWLAGDRICAFWRRPGVDNKIAFRLGKKQSVTRCVRRWKQEIAGLSRAFFTDVRVFIVAALVVVVASGASIRLFGKGDFPTIAVTAASLVAILAALYAFLSKLLAVPRRFRL
jgi:hypothetical protein